MGSSVFHSQTFTAILGAALFFALIIGMNYRRKR